MLGPVFPPRRSAIIRRARPRLRGLLVTRRADDPAELPDLVPWPHLDLLGRTGIAHVRTPDGDLLRINGLPLRLRMHNTREIAAARRLHRRALRNLYNSGAFEISEQFPSKGAVWVEAMIVTLSATGLVAAPVGALLRGVLQAPPAPGMGTLQLFAIALISICLIPLPWAVYSILTRAWRFNLRRLTLTGDQIAAELTSGAIEHRSWRDLRSARVIPGYLTLDFVDGLTLHAYTPPRVAAVIGCWHERHDPESAHQHRLANRRLVIRIVLYCFVGGMAAAAISAHIQALGYGPTGSPWFAFLLLGVGLPALLAIVLLAQLFPTRHGRRTLRRALTRPTPSP